MAAQPNIGMLHRMIYVAAGLGLMWLGFTVVNTAWLRMAMPIGGAILVIQGFIGWCGSVAFLRRGAVANRK
ncbi:MAG: YgaP family membrane protein [Candidatus Acidiferrales bacterium]